MTEQSTGAAPAASTAAHRTAKDKRVTLRTAQKYLTFRPGGDLPPVTYAGTEFTSSQADEVRTSARKHGVRVVVVTDSEKED